MGTHFTYYGGELAEMYNQSKTDFNFMCNNDIEHYSDIIDLCRRIKVASSHITTLKNMGFKFLMETDRNAFTHEECVSVKYKVYVRDHIETIDGFVKIWHEYYRVPSSIQNFGNIDWVRWVQDKYADDCAAYEQKIMAQFMKNSKHDIEDNEDDIEDNNIKRRKIVNE